ncbi:MAG TPA: DNA/RNA non-specific endonuclease [Candidatus Merdiplasma excrementigallinarum]|uniref:DNA/RNA non-specific endonuclease n=1 Tax=Candidatus Merdiplasma excrementigallinarum TaxID=2840864 RepID=A0A9D1T869_9FIRM|nr:DNA/RNA non-specific endonuclease [Candidatus Merdiplasma excrementigallinarum]
MSRRGGRTRRYTKTGGQRRGGRNRNYSRPGTYGARRRSLLPGGKGTPGLLAAVLLLCLCWAIWEPDGDSGSGPLNSGTVFTSGEVWEGEVVSLDEIPEYRGEPYVEINGNRPDFSQEDRNTEAFEAYSSLDSLGRCGTAFANVGQELMPRGERENISQIHPTGWQHVEYDFVDGESLYNRCHLIAHQLTDENANERNLITGTRYMNTEGMLPFEEMVGDYVREEDGHVLYRVTPVFEGSDLVARGVEMEGYSVEDQGESVSFHIFAYNVQPGVEIDYATGDNWLAG